MLPRLAGWVIIWTAGVRYDHRLVHLNINHHKSENVSHHQIIFSPNHFKWKTDYNFPPLVFMFSLSFRVLIDLNVLRSEKWVVRSGTDVKTGGSLSSNWGGETVSISPRPPSRVSTALRLTVHTLSASTTNLFSAKYFILSFLPTLNM